MTKAPTVDTFVAAVRAKLKQEKRSVSWLAGEAGIGTTTLQYQLHNPHAVSLRNALAVSTILGVPLGAVSDEDA